jgi:hypothetical protein
MKNIVLVIGIATGVLSRARGASYSSPASAPDSGWYRPGAITVNPGQVFEN